MRVLASAKTIPVVRCWVSILALALTASACTTSGATRPAQIETRDESGFTITEEVRVSSEARRDFERAVRLFEQEQYESGIALLLDVTEASPDLTAAHIDLGIAYGRLNDLERAEASIERALELNPRHPVALNESGILHRKAGRFAKARKSYEKALSIYPDFHFARRNLAILCDMYLADLECAMQHYELYTQAVPDDQAAAMWIADLRNRIER
jgi:tetratricopeptide (TPR) repeat protein